MLGDKIFFAKIAQSVPKWPIMAPMVQNHLDRQKWSEHVVSQYCPQNYVINFFVTPCIG